MREAKIDRLLAAAVHQAIADLLPNRLEFYESYLRPRGWREDSVNLAPISAVLSFLRHEDEGTYDEVMTRAGHYAARWVHTERPWGVRLISRLVPSWLRLRRLSDVARRNLQRSYRGTRVRTTVKRGTVAVEIHGSIFCRVRDASDTLLCRYYVALFEELLTLDGFALGSTAIDRCRAHTGGTCAFRVETGGRLSPADGSAAAQPHHGS